jgi:hypothetical protein
VRIENPVGKKFCGDCGAALANLCQRCGADNPAGKRFCGECGTALKAPATSSTKTSEDSSIRVAVAPGPEKSRGRAQDGHLGIHQYLQAGLLRDSTPQTRKT